MILTFVALTDDINKVPVWNGVEDRSGEYPTYFIQTTAFSKRFMILGLQNKSPEIPATEITEVRPGVFISKMELPCTDIVVAGDDLRPYIQEYEDEPNAAAYKNVVVFQLDRAVYTYLDSGVGPSIKKSRNEDTVILNTFHAKKWMGCIAVLGENFERGKQNPPRMVGMYIDYAINGAPKSKMLHELHIKGDPKGISVSDGLIEGADTAKRMLNRYNHQKKQTFRIRTLQRLSNTVIIPESMKNAKAIFDASPADYLANPYGIRLIEVPVDEEGVVIETEDVKKNLLPMFQGRRNRSVIFCNCKPSDSFFKADLSYIFLANANKKTKEVSYFSIVCP